MANGREQPRMGDFLAVGALAGAALAFEIYLLRVFTFTQWHHFASLAVSMALLGFGAGATLLIALGDRARRWGDSLFLAGTVVAGAGILGVFALNQTLAVQPLFVVWDLRELGKLLLLDFAAFVPFFGIGVALGQVFVRWPESAKTLYAANLLGSGAGTLGAAALLSFLPLEAGWAVIAGTILAAGTIHGLSRRADHAARTPTPQRRSPALGTLSGAACIALALFAATRPLPPLHISDFKRLSYLLDLPDARVLHRSWGLRGLVTEIRSDSIRIAPGLSLRWQRPIPPQDALALDADRVVPIPRVIHAPDSRDNYHQATLGALPHLLRPRAATLVLGTSGCLTAFEAEANRAGPITWVEPNPQIVDAFSRRMIFEGLRLDDPRRFLETDRSTYDLVVFDSAAEAGDSLAEDSLVTVQAFRAALERLRDRGLVVVPFPLYNPPRYAPKLFRMVRDALRDTRATAPERHVLAIQSLQQALVCFSNRPLAEADAATARDFARRWDFDLVWLPDLTPDEANRTNQLQEPLYYESARAILAGKGDREIPRAARLYSDRPATDARPYFWNSIRWRTVPEALRLLGRQGLMLFDWAMIVLAVSVAVAAALGALLILAPLGRLPRASRNTPSRIRVFLYFAALGLAYLLIELATFQRATVLLGHPVIAATAVFATFLLGSGIGSLSARQSSQGSAALRSLFIPLAAGAVLAALALSFPAPWMWRLPFGARIVAVVIALSPLAWAMGRPLPSGLHALQGLRESANTDDAAAESGPEAAHDSARVPRLIAWAWGINSFASVVAAPLATLLSVQFGQPIAALVGAACYAVAALAGCTMLARARRPG